MMTVGTSQVHIDNLDYVGTDQPAKYGQIVTFYDKDLDQLVLAVAVYNGTGATLPKRRAVTWNSGSLHSVGLGGASAPRSKVAGVLKQDIPNGSWGYALRRGKCYGQADANLAADALLFVAVASANGRIDDTAVAGIEHCYLGRSLEAVVAGAGTDFYMFVDLS